MLFVKNESNFLKIVQLKNSGYTERYKEVIVVTEYSSRSYLQFLGNLLSESIRKKYRYLKKHSVFLYLLKVDAEER